MTSKQDIDDLATGIILVARVARTNPKVAYLVALGFQRAVEKVAAGRPLTDPTRPGDLDRVVGAIAEEFAQLLPGLYVVGPSTPSVKV